MEHEEIVEKIKSGFKLLKPEQSHPKFGIPGIVISEFHQSLSPGRTMRGGFQTVSTSFAGKNPCNGTYVIFVRGFSGFLNRLLDAS